MRRTWTDYEALKVRPSWVAPENLSDWRLQMIRGGGSLPGDSGWVLWCFGLASFHRITGPEVVADIERVVMRAVRVAGLTFSVPAEASEVVGQLLRDVAAFLKSDRGNDSSWRMVQGGDFAHRALGIARQEAFWRGKRSVPYAAGRRAQRKGGLREKHRESERLLRMTSCLFDCPGPMQTTSRPDRTPDLLSLLAAIDASHDLTALPALGDALEEAGLVYDDLSAHLRGPGPHCWGCWALEYAFSLAERK